MFELIVIAIFIWLFIKSIGLMLRLTWGMAKILAGILMVLAMPMLILCILFAGGILLLIPVAVIGLAVGILHACR